MSRAFHALADKCPIEIIKHDHVRIVDVDGLSMEVGDPELLGQNPMIMKVARQRGHGRRGAALAEPLPSTGHRVDLARVSLNYPANLAKTDRCPPQH